LVSDEQGLLGNLPDDELDTERVRMRWRMLR